MNLIDVLEMFGMNVNELFEYIVYQNDEYMVIERDGYHMKVTANSIEVID